MSDKKSIPYIKRGRPRKKPSFEEFSELYGKIPTAEIAKMYNTTPNAVRIWASEFRKNNN